MTHLHRTYRPPVTIAASDYRRLSALADAAILSAPDAATVLGAELDRARVVVGESVSPDVVAMGSFVEFRDDTTGRVQAGTLVYPSEADIEHRRFSVLTPIGAALIGVSVGQSIGWTTRTGEQRQLTVISVRPDTEVRGSQTA